MWITRLIVASMMLTGLARAADEPPVVPLWPDGAPGSEGKTSAEKVVDLAKDGGHDRHVSNVHNPTLTVYLPPKDRANGAAVVVCPGGGHRILAMDHEGYDVGRWLADRGVAGFVLKYRLAREEGSTYKLEEHTLADARRAVRLVRSKAKEWGVDPARVGMMGFSAGGEVAALAGTKPEKGQESASDPVDRQGSRPDFLVLVYSGFRPESLTVNKETPPSFLVHADDDRLSAERSAQFYLALKKAGVSGELHIYARGGHGFGMRDRPLPVTGWTTRLGEWLADRGYLGPPARKASGAE